RIEDCVCASARAVDESGDISPGAPGHDLLESPALRIELDSEGWFAAAESRQRPDLTELGHLEQDGLQLRVGMSGERDVGRRRRSIEKAGIRAVLSITSVVGVLDGRIGERDLEGEHRSLSKAVRLAREVRRYVTRNAVSCSQALRPV